MKMLTREDVKTLTRDEKLELMDLLSESLGQNQIPVSPEVEDEIRRRLKTFSQDKAESVGWEDAKRRLMPLLHSTTSSKRETGMNSNVLV
jgi:putative addiction module component (TIGR02574 family)